MGIIWNQGVFVPFLLVEELSETTVSVLLNTETGQCDYQDSVIIHPEDSKISLKLEAPKLSLHCMRCY